MLPIHMLEEVVRAHSITRKTGQKLDWITSSLVLIGIAVVTADRFVEGENQSAPPNRGLCFLYQGEGIGLS
jgi:hypothetical protein